MNIYNNTHPYYCGIDLHARTLYVCIIYQDGNTCLHKEITANPKLLQALLKPQMGNVVVGVECMHCWYWVSDICEDLGIDFILGHALYMKAIHGGKAKNDRIDSFKISNAHLKWAFSEAAVLYLRGNKKAQKFLQKLQKRMTKIKAISVLAHKIRRCAYFMLKNEKVLDESRFIAD